MENGHPSEVYSQLLRIHTKFVTMPQDAMNSAALLALRSDIGAFSDCLGRTYMS
mgnify:FL=1